MKEPTRDGDRSRRRNPPVLGGKARARLEFFKAQRGIGPGAGPAAPAAPGAVTIRDQEYAEAYLAGVELKARRQRAMMEAVPNAWRPLGPTAIPHGQTYGDGPGSRPGVSGRLSAVAVDPRDGDHLLVGAGGGGLWESRDGGASWEPRIDDQPALAVGAVVFDPSNPSIVYVGTGEGNFFSQYGAGILRSDDGGTTWRRIVGRPFVGQGFYDLLVDPGDGRHLLAATTDGVYESTDAGHGWLRRAEEEVWDLSMGRAGAAGEVLAGRPEGLFRSADGGKSWRKVELPGATPPFERMAVGHAPSNGKIAYVFGAIEEAPSTPDEEPTTVGHLWRRDQAAGPFKAVETPFDLEAHQAWYDWFLAVAPDSPDVVWLGAINVHKGTRGSGGRWTWANVSARSSGDSIHPDQHAIAFAPDNPKVVYIGNDGGLYRSPDAGRSWQSLNKGLVITEFEYLAADPEHDVWLLGGTQDNGTLRYEGTEVWRQVAEGDGGDCAIDRRMAVDCYHSFYSMGLERSTGGGFGTWEDIGPPIPEKYDSLFYPPMDASHGLVAQAGQSVWVSSDAGTEWKEVKLPAGSANASAMAIASPIRIHLGTENGRLFRLDLVSGRWKVTRRPSPRTSGYVSDLLVDPTRPDRLWSTDSKVDGGRVFRSDDGGTSWTDVSAGLPPVLPANAIELDPEHPDTVFIALDVGVWRSDDAGAHWDPYSNGLPNVLAKDLVFHRRSRLLRVATQSRGVWEIGVDEAATSGVQLYLRDSRVDSGRRNPAPAGVSEPFDLPQVAWWWQCADIKLDSPSFQTRDRSDVDFALFEDDQGVFAAGLLDEGGRVKPGEASRVYVQVRNRGPVPAADVAVRVFFAPASLAPPEVPDGFWAGFPDNHPPAGSPWQAIGPAKVLPAVDVERGRMAAFAWEVPPGTVGDVSLLAVASAAADPVTPVDGSVAALVKRDPRCGLKNATVVGSPVAGAKRRVARLELWGVHPHRSYSLAGDKQARSIVAGLLLTPDMAALARAAGLATMAIPSTHRAELDALFQQDPSLLGMLDRSAAFVPSSSNTWLPSFPLGPGAHLPLVVLIAGRLDPGSGSLLQVAGGEVVGGHTLRVLPPRMQ